MFRLWLKKVDRAVLRRAVLPRATASNPGPIILRTPSNLVYYELLMACVQVVLLNLLVATMMTSHRRTMDSQYHEFMAERAPGSSRSTATPS